MNAYIEYSSFGLRYMTIMQIPNKMHVKHISNVIMWGTQHMRRHLLENIKQVNIVSEHQNKTIWNVTGI